MFITQLQWTANNQPQSTNVSLDKAVTIGSASSSTVQINDTSVAATHATLTDNNGVRITNNHSQRIRVNRTNLAPGASAALKSGDNFRLGNVGVGITFSQVSINITCWNCKQPISANDKTCPNCGKPQQEGTEGHRTAI